MIVVGITLEGATVNLISPVSVVVTVGPLPSVTVSVTIALVARLVAMGRASRHEHAVERLLGWRAESWDRPGDVSHVLAATARLTADA